MRKSHLFSMVMFVSVLMVFTTVKAAVPQLINYQGRLTDTPGSPLSGDYEITFTLYDTPSGGASIWSETHSAVTVSDGLFAVALGSITPFSSASPAGNQIWLGITVGSDPELSPRTQMVSVIFAFMADMADTANYAHQAGSVDTAGFSYQARQADTADYAGRSLFSDTADYAGRSLFSDTADIAKGATDNSIGSAQLIDNNVTA
ncbi:MAG: hypothetical protein IIB00_08330 [candidate division Zixibacteria bacterium]|nr:hypothetical protein [candidate division Zixibacteria bacterium]